MSQSSSPIDAMKFSVFLLSNILLFCSAQISGAQNVIYNTSIQNHEWNTQVYLPDSQFYPFWVASCFVHLGNQKDGKPTMIVNSSPNALVRPDIPGHSRVIPGQELFLWTYENNKWIWHEDTVSNQPGSRGYRKCSAADVDNDGDLDFIGFVAEDPFEGNGNISMGGIDVFKDDGNNFYYSEAVFPYSPAHTGCVPGDCSPTIISFMEGQLQTSITTDTLI